MGEPGVAGGPTILVLNGPNLNLLGVREPQTYGRETLADIEEACLERGAALEIEVDFRQSNHEGQLVDWIQELGPEVKAGRCIGAVLNPAAFTHTSVAIHDAIEGVELPVVELHISNIHRREEWRHRSWVSLVASGVVMGLGVVGYPVAINALYRFAQERA
jgi:3-dehydroquinate dehydratase II